MCNSLSALILCACVSFRPTTMEFKFEMQRKGSPCGGDGGVNICDSTKVNTDDEARLGRVSNYFVLRNFCVLDISEG